MQIYVGNLEYGIDDKALKELFEAYGEVQQAVVIRDRETGRSKGFGFVTMANESEARAAIEALNQSDLNGRKIEVNQAREREPQQSRPPRQYNNRNRYSEAQH